MCWGKGMLEVSQMAGHRCESILTAPRSAEVEAGRSPAAGGPATSTLGAGNVEGAGEAATPHPSHNSKAELLIIPLGMEEISIPWKGLKNAGLQTLYFKFPRLPWKQPDGSQAKSARRAHVGLPGQRRGQQPLTSRACTVVAPGTAGRETEPQS